MSFNNDFIKDDNNPPVKKINTFLTRKFGWVVIVIISGIYLAWGFFAPVVKDQTLLEIILSSLVSMVIAISIGSMMGLQGTMTGSIDQDVKELKDEHIKTVVDANEYTEYSDEWIDEENTAALRSARKHILMSAGLKYDTYFNQKGDFLDVEIPVISDTASKLQKQRYSKKVSSLTKALNFRVTPISMAKISAETSVDLDPNKLDKEPEEYRRSKLLKSMWQKVASVVVFGKITWELLDGNGWQSLFNGAIQIGVFMLFGALSYYSSYTYMTTIYTGNLRKKINLLKRLIAYGKKKKQEVINNGNNGLRIQTTPVSGTIETDAVATVTIPV